MKVTLIYDNEGHDIDFNGTDTVLDLIQKNAYLEIMKKNTFSITFPST